MTTKARSISVIPTYSEFGEIMTLVLACPGSEKISVEEIVDALREYANILEEAPEDVH